MGNTETKKIESSGEVVNSIILNPVDINSTHMELLLTILTSIVGISFAYQLYKDYRRSIKKKYTEGSYNTRET